MIKIIGDPSKKESIRKILAALDGYIERTTPEERATTIREVIEKNNRKFVEEKRQMTPLKNG